MIRCGAQIFLGLFTTLALHANAAAHIDAPVSSAPPAGASPGFVSSTGTENSQATDTSSTDKGEEILLYAIKWSQLQRLRQDAEAAVPPLHLPEDMTALIGEAASSAANGEHMLALIYLDQVLTYYGEILQPRTDARVSSGEWQVEMISGSDLWQQQFAISLADQDSTIRESQGNPYIGVRGAFSGKDARGAILRAGGEGKYGEEYLFGSLNAYFEAPLGRAFSLAVQDRLENTYYREDDNLRYWNNQFRGRLSWNWHNGHSIQIEEEGIWRRYRQPGALFTNYAQQQWSLRLQGAWPSLIRYEARFDRRMREYPESSLQDYQEDLFTLSWLPVGLYKLSIRGWLQSRVRRYQAEYVDSLFTNDFGEWFGQAALTWTPHEEWALELAATWNDRSYAMPAAATPSYQDIIIEPAGHFYINGHFAIKAGYRFRSRLHSAQEAASAESITVEDYYAHAPVLGMDLNWSSLLINLQEVYEIRRYPNAPAGEYTFYADHDIHSLLLFIAWNLSAHWSANLMANIDQDLARNDQGSDARSNILNLELVYKF